MMILCVSVAYFKSFFNHTNKQFERNLSMNYMVYFVY